MVWLVSLVPTPATTCARSPTASATTRTSASFSASVVVGDSPVVPFTTRPSLPASTRWVARVAAPSRSSDPSLANGVTIAVSMRPNGVRPGMGQTLPARDGALLDRQGAAPPTVGVQMAAQPVGYIAHLGALVTHPNGRTWLRRGSAERPNQHEEP